MVRKGLVKEKKQYLLREKVKKILSNNEKVFFLFSNIHSVVVSYLGLLFNVDPFPITYYVIEEKKLCVVPVYKAGTSSIRFLFDFNYVIKKKLNSKEQDYYKLTVIRNPYSRLVSCYRDKFIINTKGRFYFKKFNYKFWPFKYTRFNRGDSFEEFAEKVVRISDKFADGHFCSQYKFLFDKRNQLKIDKVLKLETLDSDFKEVQKKFSLDSLPEKYTTTKSDWRDCYDLNLAKKIYKRYKKDFDLWYPNEHEKLLKYLEEKREKGDRREEAGENGIKGDKREIGGHC